MDADAKKKGLSSGLSVFIERAVAAEREACAKIADEEADSNSSNLGAAAAESIAYSIRARK